MLDKDYSAGEEIFVSYGLHNDESMYSNYGFVDELCEMSMIKVPVMFTINKKENGVIKYDNIKNLVVNIMKKPIHITDNELIIYLELILKYGNDKQFQGFRLLPSTMDNLRLTVLQRTLVVEQSTNIIDIINAFTSYEVEFMIWKYLVDTLPQVLLSETNITTNVMKQFISNYNNIIHKNIENANILLTECLLINSFNSTPSNTTCQGMMFKDSPVIVPDGPKVMFAIPNRSEIESETFRQWDFISRYAHYKGYNIYLFVADKVPHDHCRNFIMKTFLASDCEWLISCDADISPTPYIIDIIGDSLQCKQGIIPRQAIAAWACTLLPPHIGGLIDITSRSKPVCYRTIINDQGIFSHEVRTDLQKGTVYTCDAFGSGCFAVHKTAIQKIKSPYFKFVYDAEGLVSTSEDFYFSYKLKQAGIQLYFDTRFICEHNKKCFLR